MHHSPLLTLTGREVLEVLINMENSGGVKTVPDED